MCKHNDVDDNSSSRNTTDNNDGRSVHSNITTINHIHLKAKANRPRAAAFASARNDGRVKSFAMRPGAKERKVT
jgi:hypothetical protein